MNVNSFDYFTVLAQERSYTHAAERLHITQQSLSAHIAALERDLGCKLVVRRVPLELTYAGRTFLGYAQRMEQLRREMYQEFCDISADHRGALRVGVAFTRGRAVMPGLIAAFQAEFPNVEIDLREGSNAALHQQLLGGDIDLAIAAFLPALPQMIVTDFYRERLVLLLSRQMCEQLSLDMTGCAAAVAAGDLSPLARCPFLLGHQEDIAGRMSQELLRRAGFSPLVRARSNNMETLLALCVQGAGACFCPENLARAALSRQQLDGLHVLSLDGDCAYDIRFGYLKRSYQWALIDRFIQIARRAYPADQ